MLWLRGLYGDLYALDKAIESGLPGAAVTRRYRRELPQAPADPAPFGAIILANVPVEQMGVGMRKAYADWTRAGCGRDDPAAFWERRRLAGPARRGHFIHANPLTPGRGKTAAVNRPGGETFFSRQPARGGFEPPPGFDIPSSEIQPMPSNEASQPAGDDRLHWLISGLAEGKLSDAEFQEFSSRLAHDPEARAVWFLRNDIDVGLARRPAATSDAPAGSMPPAAPRATTLRAAGRSGRQIAAALATTTCLVALVAVVGPWRPEDRDAASAVATPATSAPLATISDARFVLVGNTTAAPVVGQPVEAGRVRLAAGVLQFTLRNGVILTLQGPAELDLIDEHRAFLAHGAAVVKVPKGMSGFRLDTATTEVLDLGTEFAVRAGNGAATDVQVYDGAVIANRAGGGLPTRLEAGEAARFDSAADRDPRRIPFVVGRFIRNTSVSRPIEDHRYGDDADYALRVYGQPRFESIRVHRAPAGVTIDGRLVEWPAPGFASALPGRDAATHGVQGSMMYDDEHLYIAAHVADPAALRNHYDPELDPHIAWQGGGLQVRFSADRRMGWPVDANSPEYYLARRISPADADREKSQNPKLSHLTLWQHAATGKVCVAINHGTRYADPIVNPIGAAGAFAADADGSGYTLEYAIPWRLLNAADDPPRSGDVLGTVWQVFWSDESGRLWRDQLIEIRNLEEPARMSPHERAACWGRAEFE